MTQEEYVKLVKKSEIERDIERLKEEKSKMANVVFKPDSVYDCKINGFKFKVYGANAIYVQKILLNNLQEQINRKTKQLEEL